MYAWSWSVRTGEPAAAGQSIELARADPFDEGGPVQALVERSVEGGQVRLEVGGVLG